jgi:hypothetical protein
VVQSHHLHQEVCPMMNLTFCLNTDCIIFTWLLLSQEPTRYSPGADTWRSRCECFTSATQRHQQSASLVPGDRSGAWSKEVSGSMSGPLLLMLIFSLHAGYCFKIIQLFSCVPSGDCGALDSLRSWKLLWLPHLDIHR